MSANKNAHDAKLNMMITFGSLQILPPLEESRPGIQQKLEKRYGKRQNWWQNIVERYLIIIYGQEHGRLGSLQFDNRR